MEYNEILKHWNDMFDQEFSLYVKARVIYDAHMTTINDADAALHAMIEVGWLPPLKEPPLEYEEIMAAQEVMESLS